MWAKIVFNNLTQGQKEDQKNICSDIKKELTKNNTYSKFLWNVIKLEFSSITRKQIRSDETLEDFTSLRMIKREWSQCWLILSISSILVLSWLIKYFLRKLNILDIFWRNLVNGLLFQPIKHLLCLYFFKMVRSLLLWTYIVDYFLNSICTSI